VLAFWTDDARVVMPGDSIMQGRDAIRRMVTRGFETPGFHVTWTPETAFVASSGELGYTRGTNEFTVPDSARGTVKLAGRYLTVWRKGADGEWRCVEDYSSPAPAGAK
jgi:ketosteroid isomerase-like protein